MEHRKDMFVLNDFLKFERQLYQFAGFKVGRPLKLKTVGYFFGIVGLLLVWNLIPVLNFPLKILPNSLLYAAPFIATYLLVDIGTENRSPLKFFRSMCGYHYRKFKRKTYYKGKELESPKSYGFGTPLSVKDYPIAKPTKTTSYHFKGYMTTKD